MKNIPEDFEIKVLSDSSLSSQVDENEDIYGDYVHIIFDGKYVKK